LIRIASLNIFEAVGDRKNVFIGADSGPAGGCFPLKLAQILGSETEFTLKQ
jgi:hypothetical protein